MPRQVTQNSQCLYYCIIVNTSDVVWLSFCTFSLGYSLYYTTRRPVPEYYDLHEHCCENLKYCKLGYACMKSKNLDTGRISYVPEKRTVCSFYPEIKDQVLRRNVYLKQSRNGQVRKRKATEWRFYDKGGHAAYTKATALWFSAPTYILLVSLPADKHWNNLV